MLALEKFDGERPAVCCEYLVTIDAEQRHTDRCCTYCGADEGVSELTFTPPIDIFLDGRNVFTPELGYRLGHAVYWLIGIPLCGECRLDEIEGRQSC